jgi:hypothetical protein
MGCGGFTAGLSAKEYLEWSKKDRIKLIGEDLEEKLKNEGFGYAGTASQPYDRVKFNPNQYRLNPKNLQDYDLRFFLAEKDEEKRPISYIIYARKRPLR